MADIHNQTFNTLLITLGILVCLWILAGSSIAISMTIIVLIIKLFEIRNSNSTKYINNANGSLSSEVCMNCFSEMKENTTEDSETKLNEGSYSQIIELHQQKSDDDDDNNRSHVAEPSDLEKEVVQKIDEEIAKNEVGVVLVTLSPNVTDASKSDERAETIDTTNSGNSSDATSTTESSAKRSAFVTDGIMPIAVSYSGTQRKRVLNITTFLKKRMQPSHGSDSVFFDRDFQHEICRINGQSHLHKIYRQAQMVVVFLSDKYPDSRHCSEEWRTIAQRFISTEKNKETVQLLLVKLGEYDMQELHLTDNDFPLNALRMSNSEVADVIFRRYEAIRKKLEQEKQ